MKQKTIKIKKIHFDLERFELKSEVKTIKNELQSFYKEIGCSTIDFAYLNNGFIAIVDDEGLLVSNNPYLEYSHEVLGREIALAGTVLIVADDENSQGDIRGLTEQEIESLNGIRARLLTVTG